MNETVKTLVCFGDSLTEGAIGASYVDIVRERLAGQARVVNAGVNGDTTLNLLGRVERDVIALQPDAVVILAGLNDLTTAYATLRERSHARLALCTLTTVGERLDDPFQAYIDAYCAIIRALAEQERLPLIDLRAAFCAALAADPRDGPPYHIWTPLLDWATIGLRGQSYAALAERRGYRLLCDGAHLAEAGALLVAETMLPTLGPLLQITDQGPTTNDQRP